MRTLMLDETYLDKTPTIRKNIEGTKLSDCVFEFQYVAMLNRGGRTRHLSYANPLKEFVSKMRYIINHSVVFTEMTGMNVRIVCGKYSRQFTDIENDIPHLGEYMCQYMDVADSMMERTNTNDISFDITIRIECGLRQNYKDVPFKHAMRTFQSIGVLDSTMSDYLGTITKSIYGLFGLYVNGVDLNTNADMTYAPMYVYRLLFDRNIPDYYIQRPPFEHSNWIHAIINASSELNDMEYYGFSIKRSRSVLPDKVFVFFKYNGDNLENLNIGEFEHNAQDAVSSFSLYDVLYISRNFSTAVVVDFFITIVLDDVEYIENYYKTWDYQPFNNPYYKIRCKILFTNKTGKINDSKSNNAEYGISPKEMQEEMREASKNKQNINLSLS